MINLITQTQDLNHLSEDFNTMGFVPTMGNLHQGHLSLLKQSIMDNQKSIISIFINPTQFNERDDFEKYPKTLEQDLERIKSITPEDYPLYVFAPQKVGELYPEGENLIKAPGPTTILEGSVRPGHFDGMATIVKKLFEVIPAKRAYFGKKDYQQLAIVQLLVMKYKLSPEIIPMPIIRESDGLAMSSRNSFLNSEERKEALTLYSGLLRIQKLIQGGNSFTSVQSTIKELLQDKRFHYISLANPKTLQPIDRFLPKMVILGNLQLGSTKLIDNLEVEF